MVLILIDPDIIEVADIHRLPQYPITKNGIKLHRPIIVKLMYVSSVKEGLSSAKVLLTRGFFRCRRSYILVQKRIFQNLWGVYTDKGGPVQIFCEQEGVNFS